jgi:hypothetical protein
LAAYFKKPVDEIFQLVEEEKSNFPSVPGCGQEHQMMPEKTERKKAL